MLQNKQNGKYQFEKLLLRADKNIPLKGDTTGALQCFLSTFST